MSSVEVRRQHPWSLGRHREFITFVVTMVTDTHYWPWWPHKSVSCGQLLVFSTDQQNCPGSLWDHQLLLALREPQDLWVSPPLQASWESKAQFSWQSWCYTHRNKSNHWSQAMSTVSCSPNGPFLICSNEISVVTSKVMVLPLNVPNSIYQSQWYSGKGQRSPCDIS